METIIRINITDIQGIVLETISVSSEFVISDIELSKQVVEHISRRFETEE